MVQTHSGKETSPYTIEQQEKMAALVRESKERKKREKQAKLKAIADEQAVKMKRLEEEMKKVQQEEEERRKAAEAEVAAEEEKERMRIESGEGSSSGTMTRETDIGLEKRISEWVANLSLGEEEAESYVVEEEAIWQWDKDCTSALEKLKRALIEYPVLNVADPSSPFVVATDASQYGIGAVLQQDDDNGYRPVEFMSARMPCEKVATSTYERELYALRQALDHWKHYLLGRHFKVYSDHETLRWLKTQAKMTPKLTRWAAEIDQFDFELKPVKGKYIVVADALSRRSDYFGAVVHYLDIGKDLQEKVKQAEEPMKRTRYRSNSGSGSRGTATPYLHHSLPHHLPQHLHEAIVPSSRVEEEEDVEDGEEEEEEELGRVAVKGTEIRRGMVEEEISPHPRNKRARRSVSSRYYHQHQRSVIDGMMSVGIGADNERNRRVMGTVAGISGGEIGRGFKRKSEGPYLDAHEGGEMASGVSCPPPRRFHDMSTTTAHSGGRGGMEDEGEWGADAPELTPREVKRWKRETLKREIDRCISLQARVDDLIRRKQMGARDLGGGGVRHQQQLHAIAPSTSGYRTENGSSNGFSGGRAMAGAGVCLQQQQQRGRLAAAVAPPPLTSTEPFPSSTTTARSDDIVKGRMKETSSSRSGHAEDMAVAVPAVTTKETRLSSRQASLTVADNVVAGGSLPAGLGPSKEKRTPKANPVYNNSEFVSGKDRVPTADKSKGKSSAGTKRGGATAQAKPLSVYEAKKQKIETVRAKRMADIMKQCAAVLRKIQNQKNSWVFNEPVNWVQLKLYDYPKIIKKPMDLGTVRRKLESGVYGVPGPFAEDVRLVFSNAMTYNQPNSEVHDLAKDLLGMFEERYKNIEDKLAEEAIKFRVEEEALAALAGEVKPPAEVRGPASKVVNQPKTGPKVPQQQQLVERRVPPRSTAAVSTVNTGTGRQYSGGKAKPPPPPPAAAAATPTALPPSLPPPSPPQQQSAMEPMAAGKRPMTMEEKRKLSQNLGQLPGEKLGHIVHILSLRNPSLNQGEDEIELDIDSLDTETLWDLHSFVSSCMKSSRRNATRGGGGGYDHHESDEHDAWIHSSGDLHRPQDEEEEEDEDEEKKACWAKNHQSSSSTRPASRKQGVGQEFIGEEESRKGDSASVVRSPKDDAKRIAPEGVEEDVDIDDGAPTAIFSPVVIEKDDGGYGSKSSSSSSSSGDSESSSSDSESGSSSGSDSEPEEPVNPPGADASFKISGAEPTGSSGGTDCRGPSSSPAPKKNSVKNENHATGSGERLNDEDDAQKHKMSLPSSISSREPAQVDEQPLDCTLDELPGTTFTEIRSPVEVAVAMQDVAVGDAPCPSDSLHTTRALSTFVEDLVDTKAPVKADHTQGLVALVDKLHVANVGVMHDSAEVQCPPKCIVVNQEVSAAAESVAVDTMMLSSDDAAPFSLPQMVEVGRGTLVQSGPSLEMKASEQGAWDEPSSKPTARDVSEHAPPPMLSPALSPLVLTPATMQRPSGPTVAIAEIAGVAESSPPPPPPVTPIASGAGSLIAVPATSGVLEGSAEELGPAADSSVVKQPPSACVPEEKVVPKSEVDHLLGSEVAVRAAMLRGRFAETIIKAREKIAQPSLTNAKVEKIDPETVKRQLEETRRRQKEARGGGGRGGQRDRMAPFTFLFHGRPQLADWLKTAVQHAVTVHRICVRMEQTAVRRLDFMHNSLDQILDLLQRPGFRPAAQSPLPLTAMSGPFPVQAGTQPSGTSAAAAQTVASSSCGSAVVATPSPQQQGQWYPKNPMKPPLAFSGEKKDEELNTWLRTVPVWVRAKEDYAGEEVITAASYLEGKAAKWMDGLVAKAGYFLLGRFFYLRTNHQILKWIKTQPALFDALERWIEVIDQYDFKLEYLKGEYNKVADALSRRADYLGARVFEFGVFEELTQSLVGAYQEDPVTMDIIRKLQAKDKATEDEFVMVDGLLSLDKAGFKRLVVPSSERLRSLFLGESHDATGHFGYKKTSAILVQRFWWFGMLEDAKKYVETCQVCQRDKPRTRAPLGLLKPLPIPAGPGQSVSIDFMDTLVTSRSGKRHIFVIIDRFTKDVRFTSELWKKTVEQMGSQLQMTSGNYPEANGQAEQMNRVVQHLLRHYIKPSQDEWDEKLPLIASLYNNVVHSSTDVSPNQLHLGWKPRSALDFLLLENGPSATPGTLEYGVKYEKLLQQAVEHIKKGQQTMIASKNKHRRQFSFQERKLEEELKAVEEEEEDEEEEEEENGERLYRRQAERGESSRPSGITLQPANMNWLDQYGYRTPMYVESEEDKNAFVELLAATEDPTEKELRIQEKKAELSNKMVAAKRRVRRKEKTEGKEGERPQRQLQEQKAQEQRPAIDDRRSLVTDTLLHTNQQLAVLTKNVQGLEQHRFEFERVWNHFLQISAQEMDKHIVTCIESLDEQLAKRLADPAVAKKILGGGGGGGGDGNGDGGDGDRKGKRVKQEETRMLERLK
ncbi:hypothetical protein CBR_g41323 [Chara braunii]|uniref:Bromo domain-containing protein n=1 Tax=Chara braunii TaxID=69332 RepID=A0A388LVH9_CHABU|nr:hypothetical protein CBR_g41323 [Chara braunii]|eukprot:GBG86330.1 hypothetical protein CBR_g41323 [Chara braunii]